MSHRLHSLNQPAAYADFMNDSILESAAIMYGKRLIAFPEESILHNIRQDRHYAPIRSLYGDLPGKLADFFAVAQTELYLLALQFNSRIGKHFLAGNSRDMITLIRALVAFSDSIRNSANNEMTTRPAELMNQLRSCLKILKEKNGCDIPVLMQEFDVFTLSNTKAFGLKNPLETSKEAGNIEDLPRRASPHPGQPAVATVPDDDERKIFSVFISSTYTDMKEIRQAVMQELLLSNDYNPIGMEAFSASNDDQLTYITKQLENTDLYVLILGGRYGTLLPDRSMSYTQKEFEMAEAAGIEILPFICEDPEHLPQDRCDTGTKKEQLDAFREKAKKRTVSFWRAKDLKEPKVVSAKVFKALSQTDKSGLKGWVRGPERSEKKRNQILEQAERGLLPKDMIITGFGNIAIPEAGISNLDQVFKGKVGVPKLLQLMQPTIQNPHSRDEAKLALDENLSSWIDARFHMDLHCWTDLLSDLLTYGLISIRPLAGPEHQETIQITDTGTEFIQRHPERTSNYEIKPGDFQGHEPDEGKF